MSSVDNPGQRQENEFLNWCMKHQQAKFSFQPTKRSKPILHLKWRHVSMPGCGWGRGLVATKFRLVTKIWIPMQFFITSSSWSWIKDSRVASGFYLTQGVQRHHKIEPGGATLAAMMWGTEEMKWCEDHLLSGKTLRVFKIFDNLVPVNQRWLDDDTS